jgi:hypothetical protein
MNSFYDPHPGLAGASARLPEVISIAAKELDGKEMEIPDAVKILQDAADVVISAKEYGSAKVEARNEYIGLTLIAGAGGKNDYPQHHFRVIRYK